MPALPHSARVSNAIEYGSGRVPVRDMMRAGLLVNILAWGVIIAVSAATLRWFG